MDKLPIGVIRQMYAYDPTYTNKFNKVLKQLFAHCFIYRLSQMLQKLNNCHCYCETCRTYLKFCQHNYYDEMSTYEDELKQITPLFDLKHI